MTDSAGSKTIRSLALAMFRWLSADNVCLIIGIALMTAGAAQWSGRSALLTSGGLILAITVLRIVLDGRR